MADGDEKIDHNDRVLVLNRVQDAKVEIQFNGCIITWQPGEVRSIQRMEAIDHYVRKSRICVDPTGETFPIEKLVVVNEARAAIEVGASAAPLTAAECRELAKLGFIDSSKLPPDRLIGGMLLRDPITGQYPARQELRGTPPGGDSPPPRLALDRGQLDRDLDALHRDSA